MVGNSTLSDIEIIRTFLVEASKDKTESFSLHTIITHGRYASCNGTITQKGGKTVAFCDVYHFVDTMNNILRKIQSYGIEL